MKKYEYINYLTENIQVEHSNILDDSKVAGKKKVLVYFTNTFTHAEGIAELPTYQWISKDKLSPKDILFCQKALRWNTDLIWKYAEQCGFYLDSKSSKEEAKK